MSQNKSQFTPSEVRAAESDRAVMQAICRPRACELISVHECRDIQQEPT